MNNGSITEFFYNIIPGTIFLILMDYFGFNIVKILLSKSDPSFTITAFIIIGLFAGFVFQGMTKLVREKGWNENIARKVKNENEKLFKSAFLKVNNIRKEKDYKEPEKFTPTFHLMDNHLRGEYPSFLPTHFSARFAFWANIFFAFLILVPFAFINIVIYNSLSVEKFIVYTLLFIFLILSKILSDKYFFAFYDTILKSYFMLKVKK